MPSIYHDREWQRDTVCQDPHTSPGLPPLTYRGELEGFWRAKFLFYDFDHYRQILAGNMRGVYTGTFAEQAADMEFRETIIKVRVEEVGGTGPLLCAGFDEEDGALDEEQKRIESGYGHQVLTGDELDEPGWTKEILISGRVSPDTRSKLIVVSHQLGMGPGPGTSQVMGWFAHFRHYLFGKLAQLAQA